LTRFVGLTGGIGAGKSETLAAFERAGAATLSTDRVTHDLLDDEQVKAALVERWGEEVAPNGAIDRQRVGEIVFDDRDQLA
jgi:dephospho-CoA kinase